MALLRWLCIGIGLTLALQGCGVGDEGNVKVPQLTSPAAGEALPGTARPVAWNSVQGAEGYRLRVGTTPGDNDVFDSGHMPATQLSVILPADTPRSTTLHARLEYLLGRQWFPDPDV